MVHNIKKLKEHAMAEYNVLVTPEETVMTIHDKTIVARKKGDNYDKLFDYTVKNLKPTKTWIKMTKKKR